MLKLSSYNASVMFVMARPTKGNSIVNVYSQLWKIFIRLYMMSDKRFFTTAMNAFSISSYNFGTPVNVRLTVSPLSVRFSGRVIITQTIFTESRGVRYVCTFFTTIKSFAEKVRIKIKHFTAPLAFSIFTLFGHQSEYNKLKGVNQ